MFISNGADLASSVLKKHIHHQTTFITNLFKLG